MANKPTKDTGVKTPVAPKPTHILRYIDKVNHETGDGPEPKSNDWYHKKHPYQNIDNAKSEIQNTKPKIVKSPMGNVKIIPEKKESWDQDLKIMQILSVM